MLEPNSRIKHQGEIMAQIKIYGMKEHLNQVKATLSDIIHSCVVDALHYPQDKRAHRFFGLEQDDFYYPAGRTDKYIIIEISMFEGRSIEAKKRLIRLLKQSGYDGTITLEVFATDRDYLLWSAEKVRRWWAEA